MARRRLPLTLDDAYDEAVRMLARKARSAAEVKAALVGKGTSVDDADSVVARLKAHRHLDDAEFAADQAFSLLDGKGTAPEAIVRTLEERGIASSLAREAVASIRDEREELDLCREALSRRLKGRALDASVVAREGRALARLGWEEDLVSRVLEEALSKAAQGAQET